MTYRVPNLLLACLLAASPAAHASEAWRSNCKVLDNQAISPFIYYSQSDVAVLATYSHISQVSPKFDAGQKVEFSITPICWIKGFVPGMALTVESGSQKCRITPLSHFIEFPSLFFLRKQKGTTDKWLLLNSGEFSHQANTRGLLFGVGPAGEQFPQLCGLRHRRLPIDAKCEHLECRNYCNFRQAPADNCFKPDALLAKHMAKADIPKPKPEYVAVPSGKKAEEEKGEEKQGYETKTEKAGPTSKKGPGGAAASVVAAAGVVLLSALFALSGV